MTNREIALLLEQMAAALEVKGKDRFRLRAYENAASSIEHLTTPVKQIWQQQKLKTIPGIGDNLASHLDELFRTGKVKHFQSITKSLPQGMFELLQIPGIGPKTALKLSKKLKLTKGARARAKLLSAAKKGKIKNIEGFAEKSEELIKQGIQQEEKRKSSQRIPISLASNISGEVIKYLKQSKEITQIEPLGSLRRRNATVGDIDIAVATKNSEKMIAHFTKFPQTQKVLAQGGSVARIKLQNGIRVDIKTQTPEKFGALLQHFTGSKKHNIHLREIAVKKGLSLSEHGIKNKAQRIRNYSSEEEFYRALGMKWIPPEIREDAGEIEAAQKNKVPNLVKLSDIKGDLHTHTNYHWISSHDTGLNSFDELVDKAEELGYEYLAIGDHNPSVSSYSKDKLITEIKKRNEKLEQLKSSISKRVKKRKLNLLNTLEVDIKPNGELAVPEEGLKYLDFAMVSAHSSFSMSKDSMTKRIIEGLSHPKAKILGHPTGRLINKRTGYQLNWDKVFDFCQKSNKAIEINADPARLDLPDTLVRQAVAAGVMFAIGTDAHSLNQMTLMPYGVDVARRGWAEKKNILNTLPWDKFRAKIGS